MARTTAAPTVSCGRQRKTEEREMPGWDKATAGGRQKGHWSFNRPSNEERLNGCPSIPVHLQRFFSGLAIRSR